MRIRLDCRLAYALPKQTPVIAMLNVHCSGDLRRLRLPRFEVWTDEVPR
jgi:hypothetical protein